MALPSTSYCVFGERVPRPPSESSGAHWDWQVLLVRPGDALATVEWSKCQLRSLSMQRPCTAQGCTAGPGGTTGVGRPTMPQQRCCGRLEGRVVSLAVDLVALGAIRGCFAGPGAGRKCLVVIQWA